MLGDVTSFNRYVSTSTNAKEFQKRTFFYRTGHLARNPEADPEPRPALGTLLPREQSTVPGNGALLDLNDGYLHVAGIGQVPSDLGWSIDKKKQFAPRIGTHLPAG